MAKQLPGNGFLGWLGRQIGHVKKAVNADVVKESQPPSAAPQVLHRSEQVEEAEMPGSPGVVLRRTIIDEVVVEKPVAGKPETRSPASESNADSQ